LLDFAASAGLDVRREKLAKALDDLNPEKAAEEPTVVASEPTRTAVFAEDRTETLVERTGNWERTILLMEDTEKAAAAPSSRSGRWVAAGVMGFILAYTVTAGLVWLKSGKPPFPPPAVLGSEKAAGAARNVAGAASGNRANCGAQIAG
jgi:hypothetical protein